MNKIVVVSLASGLVSALSSVSREEAANALELALKQRGTSLDEARDLVNHDVVDSLYAEGENEERNVHIAMAMAFQAGIGEKKDGSPVLPGKSTVEDGAWVHLLGGDTSGDSIKRAKSLVEKHAETFWEHCGAEFKRGRGGASYSNVDWISSLLAKPELA